MPTEPNAEGMHQQGTPKAIAQMPQVMCSNALELASVSQLAKHRINTIADLSQDRTLVGWSLWCLRTLPLSDKGQRAVSAYLEQARLTPAWMPAVPEAQETLLLTEKRYPFTKKSLTLLFSRLNQRAGFTTKPICPSMLRETYAIRFLQAGGELSVLQEQLGLADPASVKRYQHFCDEQQKTEVGVQVVPEGQARSPQPARRSKSQRQKRRRRR